MFKTIYKYELKYWAKQISVYLYATIFLALAILLMAVSTDVFEESSAKGSIGNSPFRIYDGMRFFSKFILFLLPIIFGVSVYRDFKTKIHHVLYSFPFNKQDYLLAKFLSAFTVMGFILSTIGIGFIIGAHFLGAPAEKVAAFNLLPYLKGYGFYLLPNVLLFGTLVFAVVTLSRNIYSGFIAVILVLFLQQILMRVLPAIDSSFIVAILEPFGEVAISLATRFWTAEEKNFLVLPIGADLIINRIVWSVVALLIGILLYRRFHFSQTKNPFSFFRKKGESMTKNNFGSIKKVKISTATYDFSFNQNLKTTWQLSTIDFRYITRSWAFIILFLAGLLLVIFMTSQMNRQFGGKVLPVTWLMLAFPVFFFSMVVNLLTFLYAGMLVHRSRIASINQLIDVTPIPNWVLLFSKFIALVKMQVFLLLLVMIGGMAVQVSNGYYNFEIGHYIGTLYGLYLPSFVIWALVALWVQTLLKNPYLGIFLLLMGSFALGVLKDIGIEQSIFHFNENPDGTLILGYSDLVGYGARLVPFYVYKFYWLLFGLFMLFWALLLWTRGLPHSVKERLQLMKTRFKGRTAMGMLTFLIAFITLGSRLYYEENVVNTFYTKKEKAALENQRNKKHQHFANTPQPRMVDLDINMHIYPHRQRFEADGVYTLINKTSQVLDTLLVEYAEDIITKYEVNTAMNLVSKDSLARFDVWTFEKGLAPNDSVQLSFAIHTIDNTIFRKNNIIETNGTYLHSLNFPSIGWWRNATMPTDSIGLKNMYRSKDADFVDFKAVVSTSSEQIAIAPGYLQNEWTEGNRRYFEYKSTNKVTNDFIVNSGDFEVAKDEWQDVDLEIYYHKGHPYNIATMMEGMKAGLEYCSENFAPYQHDKLTIVEFARSLGGFAQSFANTMPFSEMAFLRDVTSPEKEIMADLFSGTAHEVAHQWWGHQVIPANALGATMLTEGMAEYVKLKTLEHYRDKKQLYTFLEKSRLGYLRSAAADDDEQPLLYNKGQSQGYIPYQKGCLAFYAMSDYLGEENFHAAIRKFIQKVRFKTAPYTTSIEMVNYIQAATPDSLQYLIKDLFETITLYDNQVVNAKITDLANGQYQVDLEFLVSKYRKGKTGKWFFEDSPNTMLSYQSSNMEKAKQSLPLADYLDIGIFDVDGNELYLQKHKITQIENRLSIIVNEKPVEVGIDPYVKMIDRDGKDNRQRIE